MSANVLSKAYPEAHIYAEHVIRKAVTQVMSVADPWFEALKREELSNGLFDIFSRAIELSRTLRKQRACWYVRFPDAHATTPAQKHTGLLFDPDSMPNEFGIHKGLSKQVLSKQVVDIVVNLIVQAWQSRRRTLRYRIRCGASHRCYAVNWGLGSSRF
jgi:hypothetical protein